MNEPSFESLGLIAPILKAVEEQGYKNPSPIQVAAIPSLLEGRDLLGCAQTGTGKTAAFALPMIQYLVGKPIKAVPKNVRCLVVAPTRELAAQINESFASYSKYAHVSHACIFGGVGKAPQEKALLRGLDVLVATPGRLLDLYGEGKLRLGSLEVFVLDEADRMLDMGFIHDVKKIIALIPKERQTLLFSATMPPSIAQLAQSILKKPLRVDISPEKPTVEAIEQSVIYAEKNDKRHMLAALIEGGDVRRALVFTRTKHGADKLVKSLEKSGISASAIHANKSQNNRIRTLEGFRSGEIRILVATDLAARGIDVDGITHVFNYELPNEPETYVHRIGRTARAGADGIAIALCESEEKPFLRDIERLIGRKIPMATGTVVDEAFKTAAVARAEEAKNPPPVDARDRGRRDFDPRGPRRGSPKSSDSPRSGSSTGTKRTPRESTRRETPATRSAPDRAASPSARRSEVSRGQGTARPSTSPAGRGAPGDKAPARRPATGRNTTGRAPSSRAGSDTEGSRSSQDAIRNAIRNIARGEDDFLLQPRAKPEGKGKK